MSLFSHEEICEGCPSAVFHTCCDKFCHCKDGCEHDADAIMGVCEHRINKYGKED